MAENQTLEQGKLTKEEVAVLCDIVVNNGKYPYDESRFHTQELSNLGLLKDIEKEEYLSGLDGKSNPLHHIKNYNTTAIILQQNIRNKAEKILRDDNQNLQLLIDKRTKPVSSDQIKSLYDIIHNKGDYSKVKVPDNDIMKAVNFKDYFESMVGAVMQLNSNESSNNDKSILSNYMGNLQEMNVDMARRALYRGDYYNVDWKATQSLKQYNELHNGVKVPTKIGGKELSLEEQQKLKTGEKIYLEGLVDKNGKAYNVSAEIQKGIKPYFTDRFGAEPNLEEQVQIQVNVISECETNKITKQLNESIETDQRKHSVVQQQDQEANQDNQVRHKL